LELPSTALVPRNKNYLVRADVLEFLELQVILHIALDIRLPCAVRFAR
jgi:hypothetical protein